MFIHTNFPVSFSHESTTLLASPQFRSPVSFNLSQLAAAIGVLFVFAITPNILQYQMAVCNSKMRENKKPLLDNVFNVVASVAQLVEQLTLNRKKQFLLCLALMCNR
jgi:dipeptide/tripeptide permease